MLIGDYGAWRNGPVVFWLQMFDASPEGAESYYRLNGGPEQLCTAPSTFTIDEEGTTTVGFWSMDGSEAHNVEVEQQYIVRIDMTAPRVSADMGHLGAPTPSVALTVRDTMSSLQGLDWSFDGVATQTVNFNTLTLSHTVTRDGLSPGPHTLSYKAFDRVENVRQGEFTFVVKPAQRLSISAASRTLTRKKGIATTRLSFTSKSASGTPLAGKTVYLEKSTDDVHWKRVQTIKAGSTGKGTSKTLTFKTRGTNYWRWYSPEGSKTRAVYSAKCKIVVR